MPLLSAWSTSHLAHGPRNIGPYPSASSSSSSKRSSKPKPPLVLSQPKPSPPSMSSTSNDPLSLANSRSSSLAGKKRPRESDESLRVRARRTKSTSDAGAAKAARDREAFQRGLIAVFVPKALQESMDGRMAHYNDLLAHFLPTPLAPVPLLPPLLPLLRALTAHVTLLSPEDHRSLVSAIVALPWATGEEKFVKSFVGFCGVLVSAHPSWAKEVVGMAIRGFAWQHPSESTSPNPISRRLFHARHHLLLAHLLSLIPTLPTVIQPILFRQFPHKRELEVYQTTYMRNCCELITYCPELGQRIWGEVVDRMLRIDVEITRNQEDDASDDGEEDEDDEDQGMAGPSILSASQMVDPLDLLITQDVPKDEEPEDEDDDDDADPDPEDMSSVDSADSDSEDDSTKAANEKEKKRAAVRLMKNKLDGMLLHFFSHLEESMGQKDPHTPAAELATQALLQTTLSSGTSTPTSEIATYFSAGLDTSLPYLTGRRRAVSPAQSLANFQTLLNIFTRQILPTSSTQHIPFLLFLCASFSPSHTDLFLGLLVSQALYATTSAQPSATNAPVSLNQRIAATVYIGSIVTRARFVPDDQARQVMTYLLAYVDGKLHNHHPSSSSQELPLFYAVCQAIMLIFCFRHPALLSDLERRRTSAEANDGVVGELELEADSELDQAEEGKWMTDLEILQRALTSDLNPLLGCNPTVVNTFAKVAHQTGFAYCFSIIEANANRSRSATSLHHAAFSSSAPGPAHTNAKSVSTTTALAKKARQANIDAGLDDYFPFDPYDLTRSKRFVEPMYRTWFEVALEQESDDDDDEDDEGEEAESEMPSEMDGTSVSQSAASSTMASSRFGSLSVPKGAGGSSFEMRRRWMKDGGLSSSLEGMSISPRLGGPGHALRT